MLASKRCGARNGVASWEKDWLGLVQEGGPALDRSHGGGLDSLPIAHRPCWSWSQSQAYFSSIYFQILRSAALPSLYKPHILVHNRNCSAEMRKISCLFWSPMPLAFVDWARLICFAWGLWLEAFLVTNSIYPVASLLQISMMCLEGKSMTPDLGRRFSLMFLPLTPFASAPEPWRSFRTDTVPFNGTQPHTVCNFRNDRDKKDTLMCSSSLGSRGHHQYLWKRKQEISGVSDHTWLEANVSCLCWNLRSNSKGYLWPRPPLWPSPHQSTRVCPASRGPPSPPREHYHLHRGLGHYGSCRLRPSWSVFMTSKTIFSVHFDLIGL